MVKFLLMGKFTYNKADYDKHLLEEHHLSAFSNYLKEIVYGGSDGIVTTFAVVAGFSGAQSGIANQYPFVIVLLFGFANLFADATSMGLGNVLSIFADKDVYQTEKEKELNEIRNNPDMEKAETIYILKKKGFDKKDAETITNLYSKNEGYWVNFMMQHELELPNPENENPLLTGIATFIAFLFFGLIPLIPYLALGDTSSTFSVSILFTFLALVLLGFLRWKVTTQTLLRSMSDIIIIGGTSAILAYFVGTFFRS
ncbi:MAG: GMP synthase [Candidatus Levybacteria bacterium CG10_big_fil_rev_8_21_14_0_10_36_7]|nr:MAG: GMP synthase [Candidatus Levybacteria bacterium CG10_big_fil_rev_8_21_14_0_10_36_7]